MKPSKAPTLLDVIDSLGAIDRQLTAYNEARVLEINSHLRQVAEAIAGMLAASRRCDEVQAVVEEAFRAMGPAISRGKIGAAVAALEAASQTIERLSAAAAQPAESDPELEAAPRHWRH